ncbi:MAG: hypothetical protein C4332_16605 [Meiothermus sp.]
MLFCFFKLENQTYGNGWRSFSCVFSLSKPDGDPRLLARYPISKINAPDMELAVCSIRKFQGKCTKPGLDFPFKNLS